MSPLRTGSHLDGTRGFSPYAKGLGSTSHHRTRIPVVEGTSRGYDWISLVRDCGKLYPKIVSNVLKMTEPFSNQKRGTHVSGFWVFTLLHRERHRRKRDGVSTWRQLALELDLVTTASFLHGSYRYHWWSVAAFTFWQNHRTVAIQVFLNDDWKLSLSLVTNMMIQQNHF